MFNVTHKNSATSSRTYMIKIVAILLASLTTGLSLDRNQSAYL